MSGNYSWEIWFPSLRWDSGTNVLLVTKLDPVGPQSWESLLRDTYFADQPRAKIGTSLKPRKPKMEGAGRLFLKTNPRTTKNDSCIITKSN